MSVFRTIVLRTNSEMLMRTPATRPPRMTRPRLMPFMGPPPLQRRVRPWAKDSPAPLPGREGTYTSSRPTGRPASGDVLVLFEGQGGLGSRASIFDGSGGGVRA